MGAGFAGSVSQGEWDEGWAVAVSLEGMCWSATAGRAVGPGLPPPLAPVSLLMSWWFTSCTEARALLPPSVLLCVGSEVTRQSWGCGGLRVPERTGLWPLVVFGELCPRGRGGRWGGCPAAQLPHAQSGWEVWDVPQGLWAPFVQLWGAAVGEGGMVLGRKLGRCSCCCLCPGSRTVLCPAR